MPVTRPPLRRVSYRFSDGYAVGAFHQRQLVSPMKLRSLAGDRGIRLPVAEEGLERLDRLGVLRPVCFGLDQYFTGTFLIPTTPMTFREEARFRRWKYYTWQLGNHDTVTPYYSPWQLLYLADVAKGGGIEVSYQTLRDATATANMQTRWEQLFENEERDWKRLDGYWRPLIKLLVRLQNRYYPFVRGSTTLVFDPVQQVRVDPVEQEVREFDAGQVAQELGVTAEGVHDAYVWLARRADSLDPGRDLYLLLRMAGRRRRDRLRGDARLAHDFYDAAQVLRRYYHDLTGDVLPDANEVDWPGFTQRVLGHEPQFGFSREDLSRALVDLDVHPHGAHLFVEGETEVLLFRSLLDIGMPDSDAVKITNLHGVGGANKRAQEVLEGFSHYARFRLLVADREGEMARYAKQWIKSGLIGQDGVQLWKRSLEEDNFTDAELVRCLKRIATKRDPNLRLRLTGKQLRAAYEDHRSRSPQNPLGLVEFLLKIAGRPDVGALRASKSADLVEEMVDVLHTEIRANGWEDAAKKRPVLGLVIRIINASR